MKNNSFSKSGIFSARALVALLLFFVSALFALAALTDLSPAKLAGTGSEQSTLVSEIPLDPALGHSYWNELMTASARAFLSLGTTQSSHIFAMRAAGAHTHNANAVSHSRTLSPVVSVAVTPALSLPFRDLPETNPYSAWVERPEMQTPPSRLPSLPRD